MAIAFENVKRDSKRVIDKMKKEERAERLGNIICKRCGYQNFIPYVKKSGKCHLCGSVLDKAYFIKEMLKRCNNG